MNFATVRLGKTSVEDIRLLAAMPGGIVKGAVAIDVVCTQVPLELVEDTVVFLWLGSDNSKGMPTEWIQGFKAVGIVTGIKRGAKYNDESTTTVSLKYVFADAITRLDVLRDCPEAYYWCSSLPIIGLDDHSNQTIRCFSEDLERGEIGAYLYSLNSVCQTFRRDIVSIMPEIDNLFWATVKSPKTGDVLGASSVPETDMRHRLDAALKMFAEKRVASQSGDGKNYDESCAKTRAEAARIDGDYLARCDYDAFRKTLNSVQVANSFFSKHTEDDKRRLGDFIATVRQDSRDISFYLEKGNQPGVPGVGPAMLTAFLTRTRPDLFVFFTDQMFESVKFLGLTEDAALPQLTTDSYNTYKGIQTTIRDRMRVMGIKAENGDNADYLTVNEFTWFVSEHLKDISTECEAKKMKSADYVPSSKQPTAKKPKVNLANAEEVILLRLAAALRAKPFAILAGHSGTGKSRMVRQLAYMTAATGNHKVLFEDAEGNPLKSPGNFCMVQVKPNWHDSADLLGYYSELKGGFRGTEFVKFICKAYAYPDVPFFVCLDEMNLAPVEQYFAEYLSAIESRRIEDVVILDGSGAEKTIKSIITDRLLADEAWRMSVGSQDFSGLGCEFTQSEHWLKRYGLTIPHNLFVVGTVNMDESTNQFSRKVLDRAFTLEMTDADFEHFGEMDSEPSFEDFAGDDFAKALLGGDVVAKKPVNEAPQVEKDAFVAQIQMLVALKPILEGTSFVVAYRFANEYMLYARALNEMYKVIEVSGGNTELFATGAEGIAEATAPTTKAPEPFDDMVLMKVLPRISGDTEMVLRIFAGEPRQNNELNSLDNPQGGLAKLLGKESASFEKMKEIFKRGEASGTGTLTFWP